METVKICKKCNEAKLLIEFSVSNANKDGKQNMCKVCSRQASARYAKTHKEKEKLKKAKWYLENREKALNKAKTWNFANRTKINARKYKRYREDINFKLADILRSRISKFLRHGKLFKQLGCSLDELKLHLESQFKPGMTWNNWSKTGWNIDHIVPLSSFDLTDPEQFAKAVHYTNLQPLWAEENLSKGAKIEKPSSS